ncbi:shikimate O-hydroxycinnamoyltransferase [Salvia divinorum]|uniref:Shikimate O-hydroxycinnamoyltransferase n=1 Tax=Salvia divinorum TaxID=28513 RepID=A0ABD1H932_SALDI
MKITVKDSTIVKPMAETPSGSLWLSSLDIVMPDNFHTRYVFFYRCDGAGDGFFDAAVMKAALSRVLVEFYPFAGRLRRDDRGRIEINCSGEGVLFTEAECDGAVDDLGGFASRPDVCLVPAVDYSRGISTFPLLLVQLTRFKCGGVSLGFTSEHHLTDGISAQHFNKSWGEIARGLTPSVPPFLDRRLLASRTPPRPSIPHIEHSPPPSLKSPLSLSDTTFSIFKLTLDQINSLKQKCNHDIHNKPKFTTYEVVTGHVWRCVSAARGLPGDQETKLQLPVDARPRLRPNLPAGYLGNGIFYTGAFALCGELESEPLRSAVGRVHDAIARMDDEYLRSAIDYMELHRDAIVRDATTLNCPNVGITSWLRLPFYEVDFGWGKPAFAGAGAATFEGKCNVFSDPENEGGIYIAITLSEKHMKRFAKLLYECGLISKI